MFGFSLGKVTNCLEESMKNAVIVKVFCKRTNPIWVNNNINCQKTNAGEEECEQT